MGINIASDRNNIFYHDHNGVNRRYLRNYIQIFAQQFIKMKHFINTSLLLLLVRLLISFTLLFLFIIIFYVFHIILIYFHLLICIILLL